MTKRTQNTIGDNIRLEASIWIAKIDGGHLPESDISDFIEWAKRSPRHEEELRHQAVIWDTLDEILNVDTLTAQKTSERRRFVLWPMPAFTALAAAAATLLIIGIYTFLALENPDDTMATSGVTSGLFVTQVGEKRSVTLSDGSIITLNTDGQVEVDIQPDSRNIRLLKGEALFEVAHDKNRPFSVTAGSAVIKALGTIFAVHIQDKNIEVIVEDGRVKLSSLFTSSTGQGGIKKKSKEPIALAIISAGQGATFNPSLEAVKTVEKSDIGKKLAWRNGMLIFDGDDLEYVLRDVSRYTKQNFIISDPELRSLRISGYFPTGQTETLLATLEQSFDIIITRTDKKHIYISKKK